MRAAHGPAKVAVTGHTSGIGLAIADAFRARGAEVVGLPFSSGNDSAAHRDRVAASAAERARVNVSRTIGAVMKKIASASPALGQHLTATVRTGYFCSYVPDTRVAIAWET